MCFAESSLFLNDLFDKNKITIYIFIGNIQVSSFYNFNVDYQLVVAVDMTHYMRIYIWESIVTAILNQI